MVSVCYSLLTMLLISTLIHLSTHTHTHTHTHTKPPRTVCIHQCCFSPENAQLKLTTSDNRPPLFHSFYSVACYGSRRVVTYHVIPGNPLVEYLVCRSVQDCINMREVLLSLTSTFTDLGEQLASLILPLD